MWNFIKAEFEYNILYYTAIAVIYLAFTTFAIFNIELLDPKQFGVDYWGGFIAGFLYLFYFIMYPIRIKEQRERQNVLLPISLKQISLSYLIYFSLPVLISIIYFLVLHISILSLWNEQSASTVAQLGMFFTVVSAFIFIRQLWYLIELRRTSIKINYLIAAVIYLLILIAAILIFIRQISYELLGWYYGRMIFYLPVMINLFLSYKFFLKRKSYLT
jgi:hypothetical protein